MQELGEFFDRWVDECAVFDSILEVAELAWAALNRAFPGTPATLSAADARHLVATLAASGIGGGAVYDALVARTAMKAGLRLVTLDKRAQPTYVSVGADFDWLVSP